METMNRAIIPPVFSLSLLVLLGLAPGSAAPPGGADAPPPAGGAAGGAASQKLAEYVQRLRQLSPRDADAFYELGRWCESQGLKDKATKAFEKAIRIDADHPLAREALGYRPDGTGWTLGKPSSGRTDGDPADPPAPRPASAAGSAPTPAPGTAPSVPSTGKASAAKVAR